MDDGRWAMDKGRWTKDNGRWTMDDGQRNIKEALLLERFFDYFADVVHEVELQTFEVDLRNFHYVLAVVFA